MLVLARKSRESVVISANNAQELVRVTVIDVCGGRVKLGFMADTDVAIHREEVWERVRAEKQAIKAKETVEAPKYRVPYID